MDLLMVPKRHWFWPALMTAICVAGSGPWAVAQVAPSLAEIAAYQGLHAAAAKGDVAAFEALPRAGLDLEHRDGHGRTALHIAAHGSHEAFVLALVKAGANINAKDSQHYDIVTIASVANDVEMLRYALALGASARQVTSPYDGTALIAAAHLGHAEVVRVLIAAGAPLDHVNNLNWTAVIEAVILGNGGAAHQATLKALLDAGADATIPDRNGLTPLEHAKNRGYREMIEMLASARKK
jgi:uncharacterized protein